MRLHRSAWLLVPLLALPLAGPLASSASLAPPHGVPPPPAAPALLVTQPLGLAPPSSGAIHVAATDAAIANAFTLQAQGASASHGLSVDALDGGGSLAFDGASSALVNYVRIPWADYGLVLYQGLGVEAGDLHVAWLYCTGPSTLQGIYHESAKGAPLTWTGTGGACAGTTASSSTRVHLPAIDMAYPPLDGRMRVTGAGIYFDGTQPGLVVLDGRTQVLLPFETVDCTACGAPGWYEMHALVHDPIGGTVTFGIFYAFPGSDLLQFSYGLRLPDLARPAIAAYAATWTFT